MQNKINWYRTPIDKQVLKSLTQRNDLRGLLQADSFLLIYLGTLYLAVLFFRLALWLPLIAACYLHCMFAGFVGTEAAVHELQPHLSPPLHRAPGIGQGGDPGTDLLHPARIPQLVSV